MNNKDFITKLAAEASVSPKEAQRLVAAMATSIAETLDDETSFSVSGFGTFEVKKKLERVIVNPSTKQRKLIPPKLVLAFKQSNVFKEKINTPNA